MCVSVWVHLPTFFWLNVQMSHSDKSPFFVQKSRFWKKYFELCIDTVELGSRRKLFSVFSRVHWMARSRQENLDEEKKKRWLSDDRATPCVHFLSQSHFKDPIRNMSTLPHQLCKLYNDKVKKKGGNSFLIPSASQSKKETNGGGAGDNIPTKARFKR